MRCLGYLFSIYLILHPMLTLAAPASRFRINLLMFAQSESSITNELQAPTGIPINNTAPLLTANIPADPTSNFTRFRPVTAPIMRHIARKLPQQTILFSGSWVINRANLSSKPAHWQIDSSGNLTTANTIANGDIKLSLHKFFDLKLNFNITHDQNLMPLQQTRRMRSRQLNFIDHPFVGTFIYIEPLETA